MLNFASDSTVCSVLFKIIIKIHIDKLLGQNLCNTSGYYKKTVFYNDRLPLFMKEVLWVTVNI